MGWEVAAGAGDGVMPKASSEGGREDQRQCQGMQSAHAWVRESMLVGKGGQAGQ